MASGTNSSERVNFWENTGQNKTKKNAIGFLDVFTVQVILEKLESFLWLEDLQTMREVCRGWNGLILNLTKFRSKTKVVLVKNILLDKHLKNFSFEPKNIQIYPFQVGIGAVDKITSKVCKLARLCESLEIFNREDPGDSLSTIQPPNDSLLIMDEKGENKGETVKVFDPPPHAPLILTVLLATQNLVALCFKNGAEGFLKGSTEEQSTCLANLKILKFSSSHDILYVPRIFLGLRKLEVLRLEDGKTAERNSQFWVSQEYRKLYAIMCNNKETLSKMGTLHPSHGQDYLRDKYFPKLTSIFYLDRDYPDHDIPSSEPHYQFLHAHAHQLQRLKLVSASEGEEMVKLILAAIPHKLKTLSMTAYFLKSNSSTQTLQQNLPLSSLTTLELFGYAPEVWRWRQYSDVYSRLDAWKLLEKEIDIISYLPTDLTELSFSDFTRSEFIFNPLEVSKISSLKSLLLESVGGLSDEFMHAVCFHCTKLQYLTLELVDDMSHKAFLGPFSPDDPDGKFSLSDTPISNLKDLQRLILRKNSWEENSKLLIGIQCKNLSTFEIECNPIPQIEEVLILLRNNPCLHTLNCPIRKKDRVESMKEFLQFPNLRRVNRRVIRNYSTIKGPWHTWAVRASGVFNYFLHKTPLVFRQ